MKKNPFLKISGATILALCLSGAACTKAGRPGAPPVENAKGGISGGGGGSLPGLKVSPWDVQDVLKTAQRDLRFYLRYKENGFDAASPTAEETLLFGGAKTILTLVDSTPIDMRLDRPCYDQTGAEVEGSVANTVPGGICISAWLLSKNVTSERIYSETLALVLHELTHLLGADEQMATELQKEAAFHLRKIDDRTTQGMAERAEDLLNLAFVSLESALADLENKPFSVLRVLIEDIQDKFTDLRVMALDFPYSLLLNRDDQYLRYQSARLIAAGWYVSEADGDQGAKSLLDAIFRTSDSVTLDNFHGYWALSSDLFAREWVTRLRDRASLKSFLLQVREYVEDLQRMIFELKQNFPIGNRVGPWSPANPWEQFLGSYEVISSPTCTTPDAGIKSFSVVYGDAGRGAQRLFIQTVSQSGRRTTFAGGWAFDGGSDGWIGATVTVEGTTGIALRKASVFSNWDPESRSHTYQFSQTAKGYKLTRGYTFYKYGIPDYSVQCTYQLRKL
jgi:hypothetical protein